MDNKKKYLSPKLHSVKLSHGLMDNVVSTEEIKQEGDFGEAKQRKYWWDDEIDE